MPTQPDAPQQLIPVGEYVVGDGKPCEMCFINDAIGAHGAVPVCDSCIPEHAINPLEVTRYDGLTYRYVSPADTAAQDARVKLAQDALSKGDTTRASGILAADLPTIRQLVRMTENALQ